jgi:hypothetical protein
MAKKKSKRWSMADIKAIKKFINTAVDAGGYEEDGIKNAAAHFGVTPNAVYIRWGRYNKGIKVGKLNTTKVPIVRKKRKYTKRKGAATLVDNIKRQAVEEVQDFSQKQALTKELRKMVIDLMNTSGHIKAVSVDLSNKSFTVIF